jgi:histidinol dehydrogenase
MNDGGTPGPVRIARLDTSRPDFEEGFARVRHWSAETDAAIEARVAAIVADVGSRGDAAVLEYTARFDGLQAPSLTALELGADELRAALSRITPAQADALRAAAARVRDYHERQLEACGRGWQYRDAQGTLLGQKVTPLDRVGLYVPGGKAAYPSSVLMNAIPARVAGVGEIVMVVPTPVRGSLATGGSGQAAAGAAGERNDLVLAAASLAGVDRAFTIGGAQAVAALACGTATIPRVDKITGPGNAYVASAKRRVFGQVGIDMIAGPSEILVLADGSTPADWVAMDLFSQAEHDELAQSILLCPDAAYLDEVARSIERLLPSLPRRDVIRASLEGRGALIRTRSMQEACKISNRIAPEHLEVSSADPHRWEPLLRHAGAIFLGAWTSESLGDYCAGPNHVLPTSGTARFSSPLGVYDFQKRTSLIEVSAAGAATLGPVAAELACGEGLQAHARAAELRLPATPGLSASGAPARATRPHGESLLQACIARTLRGDVQSMHAYAIQPSAGFVKLDAMENPFALPSELQRELGERLGRVAINRYPGAGAAALMQALARHAALPESCALMLGNGSDELIDLLSVACMKPGATVLAPLPGFVMYEMSARLRGLGFVGVPLRSDFGLDADAMVAAIERHRPALTYLAYPNNPTANLFDDAAIDRVVAAVGAQHGLVVMDEAYQPFSSRTWMGRMAAHPHVLVLRTLSKFGLAGVRLGYLCGARALIGEIDKVRPPYNVGALNAEAALFALEHADEYERQAAVLRAGRERLQQALRQMPGVTAFPSEANMVLVRVPDSARAFDGLKARGILVKHIAGLHPLLANCLRLTVGTPEENERLLAALKESL